MFHGVVSDSGGIIFTNGLCLPCYLAIWYIVDVENTELKSD